MSLIDWSDPEEMLGLLMEFVADEAGATHDEDRAAFLRALLADLETVAGQDFPAVEQMAEAIREVRGTQPREFFVDEVLAHVDACVEELYRIGRHHFSPQAR